jgi:3-oxoacyl-[acyl-carrier-protein] synthase-3
MITEKNDQELPPISLVGTAGYLPEKIIENDFFGDQNGELKSSMFRGTKRRHHVAPGETPVDMIEKASQKLADRLDLDLSLDVDVIITNVTMSEIPFTGCGAGVAHRLGVNPEYVIDLHNTGCVAFVYMLDLARALLATGRAKSALLCMVQNAGGRLFSQEGNRKKPQSAIPGDGCGVAYEMNLLSNRS